MIFKLVVATRELLNLLSCAIRSAGHPTVCGGRGNTIYRPAQNPRGVSKTEDRRMGGVQRIWETQELIKLNGPFYFGNLILKVRRVRKILLVINESFSQHFMFRSNGFDNQNSYLCYNYYGNHKRHSPTILYIRSTCREFSSKKIDWTHDPSEIKERHSCYWNRKLFRFKTNPSA